MKTDETSEAILPEPFDGDPVFPVIRFGVIALHVLFLCSLWFTAWYDALRNPKPPTLQVTLLTPKEMAELTKEPPPPIVRPEDIFKPPPEPEVEPEEVPDEPEDEPEEAPPPPPKPPAPAKPTPPPPREPDVKAIVRTPVKPLPKPPREEIKPAPAKPPKPIPAKPAPPVKPALTKEELEKRRIAEIRKGLKKTTRKPIRPLPKSPARSASDIRDSISKQVRNVAVSVVSSEGPEATGGQTDNFLGRVTTILYGLWRQPSRAEIGKGQPTVEVTITVLADGTVKFAKITGRSGVSAMDGSVSATLQRLGRLPALRTYGILSTSITIEVTFELTE